MRALLASSYSGNDTLQVPAKVVQCITKQRGSMPLSIERLQVACQAEVLAQFDTESIRNAYSWNCRPCSFNVRKDDITGGCEAKSFTACPF
mmetsp:Transcript_74147/g.217591  ORF Transcript_74147/g.217591 Transcript_74147/m.217591 type:complete len:91 (-) Transcript_74147:1704-1976(-)